MTCNLSKRAVITNIKAVKTALTFSDETSPPGTFFKIF